jgi:Bacterial mobilisation protein (MobC)
LSAIDWHDLARIGSNLNQIARACNTTGDTFRACNIEATLDELRSLLRRIDAPGQASDELGEG